jgi:hypothetical protein
MAPRSGVRPLHLVVAVAVLVVVLLALPGLLTPIIAGRLRAEARARDLDLRWSSLKFQLPMHVTVRDLEVVRRPSGAPFARFGRLDASLGPRAWSLRPRVTRLEVENARVTLAGVSDEERDPTPDEEERGQGPAAPRVRAAAAQLADALLLPARRMPEIRLHRLEVWRGDSLFAHVEALELAHTAGGIQFATHGLLAGEQRVPFETALQWQKDDRLEGSASFEIPDEHGEPARLRGVLDGHVTQDRRAGILRVQPGARLVLGRTEVGLEGDVRREGPRFRISLAAKGLTASDVQESFPSAMLGPLADMNVRGSWDWLASVDVNVARPESTRFTADVVPHGLVLGADGSRLPLRQLSGPFLAHIHVPRDRIVYRELSSENPNFRPLDRISPLLRDALITNEDGAFYRHRGFNTEAIQMAMAENLRAGAFRRGAGTITMQLARNLFLGHRRTLSRKAQEVVLAWVLEHLTGLSKDRLLEIYLNIIEWGPGVHGANEAARYYFDRDASDLSLDEALFLTVLVPSPGRWKTRVDAHGELRPWARAQMAFIARKMASRGAIPPEQVPAAEQLSIRLRGPAKDQFAPSDSAAAASDSATTAMR